MLRVPTITAVMSALIVVLRVEASGRQPPPTPTPSPPQNCSTAEHREFDFWVGTWDVIVQDKPAGINQIEADLKESSSWSGGRRRADTAGAA